MKIIQNIREMHQWTGACRKAGQTIGFVPTMGALHEGHLSLIRKARKQCDRVVVSLYVNPKQFGPKEDYRRYPRKLPRDAALCRREGVDILFHPTTKGIYPNKNFRRVSVGPLGILLEGKIRPDHFSGVAAVVDRLFRIVRPHRVFFGKKDYQQTLIIQQRLSDLDFPIKMIVCPTIREPDGLAMSSRNRTLSAPERRAAAILHRALLHGRRLIKAGERSMALVRREMAQVIRSEPLIKMDYLTTADPRTLRTVSQMKDSVVLLLAARIRGTRLIDNLLVTLVAPIRPR